MTIVSHSSENSYSGNQDARIAELEGTIKVQKARINQLLKVQEEYDYALAVLSVPGVNAQAKTIHIVTMDRIRRGRPRPDGKVHVQREDIVKGAGTSLSTVSDYWKKFVDSGWYEKDVQGHNSDITGQRYEDCFFAPTEETITNPENLDLVGKKQGGKREKRIHCMSCGSDTVYDVEDKTTYRVCQCGVMLTSKKSLHKVKLVNSEDIEESEIA